jgi:hypothetical protein
MWEIEQVICDDKHPFLISIAILSMVKHFRADTS